MTHEDRIQCLRDLISLAHDNRAYKCGESWSAVAMNKASIWLGELMMQRSQSSTDIKPLDDRHSDTLKKLGLQG